MSEMTHKKNTVLLCMLFGMLISPAAVNGSPTLQPVSEADSAAALYQLGVMRMNGEGAEQDIVQGRYWIHLAARHGYPLAQYNIGVMYFDGIGGAYSRQCAQWWLNRAAVQDDPEVREMAGLALRRIEPEMAALPKVYRPVTDLECDRLPEWQWQAQPAADIPVLSQGDIDNEAVAIIQESPVTEHMAVSEEHAVVSLVPESVVAKKEMAAVKETITPEKNSSEKESVAPATPGASELKTKTEMMAEKTPAENTDEAIISTDSSTSDDTTPTIEMAKPEDGKTQIAVKEMIVPEQKSSEKESVDPATPGASEPETKTEVMADQKTSAENTDEALISTGSNTSDDTTSVVEMTEPESTKTDVESLQKTEKEKTGNEGTGVETLSGAVGINTEIPADASPDKPKTVKPREVKPTAIPAKLNLGGSPATAPGKHYTLQLSGGTTQDELYRTVRKHKLTNYMVYETVRHGQSWYVLVAGEYATLTAANQALKMLPAELRKNGPWVRSLRHVQRELSNK